MLNETWQAVALSRDLGRHPLQVKVGGQPVVIFRTPDGIAALNDRCPHRFLPLSLGRVVEGTLECPFHGWRFDTSGLCVAIPGHIGEPHRCRVPRWRVTEAEGAIFVARGEPAGAPYTHIMAGQPVVRRLVKNSTRSHLIDVVENILDPTHTHFIHKGLLRGLSTRRNHVKVDMTGGPGWVEASYMGEGHQNALVNALLEDPRLRMVRRYRHPGITEIECWGRRGLVFTVSLHLRQTNAETVEGIGWLIAPYGILQQIKALLFKPMFSLAIAQDKRVLSTAFDNSMLTPKVRPVVGPLDFLRPEIEAIMAGSLPPSAQEPRRYEILL